MSSPFIGLDVKLTLHSQPDTHLHAKILSIDQAANTLTVERQDGTQAVLKRTDIASLAASKPAATASKHPSSAHSSTDTAAPTKPQGKQKKQQQSVDASSTTKPAPPQPQSQTPADPAIMSLTRSNDSHTVIADHHPAALLRAPLHGSDPAGSRSSTPSRSPRPKHAATAVPTPKSSKKKNPVATSSRSGSPAIPNASLSEDFDFTAGLKAFDKKKIWDDIRASDDTDPAALLVSHNRIANGAPDLVRGPNGVGPANSYSTPDRGRSNVKDGQQKLRPNEMVCSPSPERASSPTPAAPAVPNAVVQAPQSAATASLNAGKPTYEQLEDRIRKLEAELALARRRNVLLEELAGLGLGTRVDAVSDHASSPSVSSPSQPGTKSTKSVAPPATDPAEPAVEETQKSLSALSLQSDAHPSKAHQSTPAMLSSALPAAGFAVSAESRSQQSTPAPATPTSTSTAPIPETKDAETDKEEPLFGHIVDPPVLTLLFPTAAIQHSALARMEAFYESDSNAKQYLSLQEAADERICRNYQGFNFPLRQGVHEWLDAMFEATNSDEELSKWWIPHCSAEENQLLEVLVTLGAISPYEGASSRNDAESGSISYIISCVASQAHSTLPHELLHALYFLSAPYRSFVTRQWDSLSAASKKVIETDLGLRKYSPSVFQDEFQAYLAEGLGTEKEFGNKPAAECQDIAVQLREHVAKEWKKLGMDLESGKQQEAWEEVKWQTLDRYAAVQKASRKANGQGKSGKGGKKGKK
ncbi:predicted enhancer of mRNA [Pseudozyma hubeiensis SY62]|uniref:Predicted enhancer of mRNA n=1 Tax=Pseudozyma hubeiensis (strain SY62) TaxID=1305764 RepID=R9P4L4_PSEHS|nr:predicted enhancer of mRNA [Pseudozyma hubeiensis SY62]GAC96192.1 predicted enhancer of mRNA [Pseudozyma hubeiensis SY62]